MIASSMRAAATCALLATTCLSVFALAGPARAQGTDIPSAYKNIDENGVDLTDGSFNFSMVEGSIGSGKGALSLIRYGIDESSLDNWSALTLTSDPATGSKTVVLGNRSETFSPVQGGFFAEQANGATLTGSGSSFVYRDADGSRIAFGSPVSEAASGAFSFCDGSPQAMCTLLALSVQEPDGVAVTLTWDVHDQRGKTGPDGAPLDAFAWRLAEVANNLGYAMRVAYQPGGIEQGVATADWDKRVSVTFRNTVVAGGATPTVSYAFPQPNITEITDPAMRTTRITTDANGRVVGIRRPGAPSDSMTVAYGANGVSRVVNEGVATDYARTVSETMVTTVIADAFDKRRTVYSNPKTGRPTQTTDALGWSTVYSYDANDRPTRVAAPEGNAVLTQYDARGNVTETRVTAKPGSGLADIVTMAGFESGCANPATCNQPLWTRDAAGKQTDYQYHSVGDISIVALPAGANGVRPVTYYYHNTLNHVTFLTQVTACRTLSVCDYGPDQVQTRLDYDTPNSQLSSIRTGAGNDDMFNVPVTTMSYDAVGNLVTVDGPLAGPADTTRTFYNAAREVVGVIGPDPDPGVNPAQPSGPLKHRAQRLERNADGDIVAVVVGTADGQSDADFAGLTGLETTRIGYDANRRPILQSRDEPGGPATSVTQQSYDAKGRLECATVRMDPAKYGILPPSACYQQYPAGPHGYDRMTVVQYDDADRPIKKTVAVGVGDEAIEAAATYTPNGQLATLLDANGNKTSYVYDGHDRLGRTLYPSATTGAGTSNPDDYEQLTYDARSQVVTRRLRDGQLVALSYDALGRLTSKDVPNLVFGEKDATYAYDNLGRLTAAGYAGEPGITFGYDALGRKVSEAGARGTTRSEYDAAGRRTRLTWGDGNFFVGYRYLVTGEMASIRQDEEGPFLARFTYDDRGRRTRLVRGNGTETDYAYDTASRLSLLDQKLAGTAHDLSLSFAYNPAGQIVETTRSNDLFAFTGAAEQTGSSVNGLNQLTSTGGASVTHDARGNLTRMTRAADAGAPGSGLNRNYRYTAENRLAEFSQGPGSPNVSLAYDPLGRLSSISSSATGFGYDGSEVIEESDAATGTLRKRYVHGPGVDEPLVVYDAAGAKRYLHADERGSVVAASDAAGTAVAVARYDEYGVPQGDIADRFAYTGQMWLGEVGVYNYKARMYDPVRGGRFLQTDPIGYESGMNLYAYVGADPVNFTDPSGLQATENVKEDEEIVVTAPRGGGGGGGGGGAGYGPSTPVRFSRAVASLFAPDCVLNGTRCSTLELVEIGTTVIPGVAVTRAAIKGGAKLYRAYRRTCGCLEAGTLVATPAGLVAIETLAVGDLVLAQDERTGEIAAKPVTDLIRPEPKRLYALQALDRGGEMETFHATDDHPWKIEGRGWVETLDLKAGDRIDTASGDDLIVTALAPTDRIENTYNLTVADWHTFLVGDDGAVVHNVDCNLLRKLALQEARSNPLAERIMQGLIKDVRYPEHTWGKFQYIHRGQDGNDVAVHFWRNLRTGAEHGFKVK